MKAGQLLSTSLEAQTRGPRLTAHLEGLKSDRRVSALPEISSALEDLGGAGPGDRRLKVGQLVPIAPTTLGMLLLLEAKSHLSSGGSWGLGDTGPVHPTVSWPGGHANPTSASFPSPPRPSFFLQLPASLPSLAADSYPADFQWHVHSQAEFSCLYQDPRLLTVPNIAHTF